MYEFSYWNLSAWLEVRTAGLHWLFLHVDYCCFLQMNYFLRCELIYRFCFNSIISETSNKNGRNGVRIFGNNKISYHRGTVRCVVSIEILPVATQQCRNYLYDKSWTKYQLSLIDPCDKITKSCCRQLLMICVINYSGSGQAWSWEVLST